MCHGKCDSFFFYSWEVESFTDTVTGFGNHIVRVSHSRIQCENSHAVMLRAESCQCVSVGIEQESFYFCRKAIRSLSLESYILMSNGQESTSFREELNIKVFCKRRQIESLFINILGIIELYFNVACGNRLQIRQGNRNQPILVCLSFTFIFNLSVFNVAVADGSISESLLGIAGKSYLGCIM